MIFKNNKNLTEPTRSDELAYQNDNTTSLFIIHTYLRIFNENMNFFGRQGGGVVSVNTLTPDVTPPPPQTENGCRPRREKNPGQNLKKSKNVKSSARKWGGEIKRP